MPINWPLLGMTPSLLWNFNHVHDYMTDVLRNNGGTIMYKGPWFSNMDMIFTSDPANFHYISSTNFHNYPKGPDFREMFDILGDGIFNCDSKLWELQHKTTMSLFNDAGFLMLLEKTIWKNVEEELIPVLEFMSEQGSTWDLQDIFQRLTFDGICNLLMDYDPKTLSVDLPYNELERAITKTEEAIFSRHLLPKYYWKLQKRLQIGNEKHMTEASKLSDELFYKFINEKRHKRRTKICDVKSEQVQDYTLLTGFMREYDDKIGSFDNNHDKIIKDTLLNLLIAGRDTTSTVLTWFFYLLAKNPTAEAKIYRELHAQLGLKEGQKWRSFGAKELGKLAYLHASLCEALRLFPPVPVNHKVSQEADTLPSNHHVRKNSIIILHSYAMGRMETIWGQDVLDFKPERWLSEQGGIKQVPSYKFTAFHAGPRTCLGKKMSLIHMKTVAATIIYNYHVKVVEGQSFTQNASVVLQMKYGLMVKVTKRNEVKPQLATC
ncbi:alkane hydroxylase MAH1 [Lactuca sativa]|uniref:alkane hydroxylase MAH1 n=1 Tax=Lactuca sativa TaxID=4236 RepID=UPI000CCA15AD|nr:alkane hydroxylase MAH1 [Lactuca sativa]